MTLEFDFDEMASLALSDPAEFERRRKKLLEEAISTGTPWQQARGRKTITDYNNRARGKDVTERIQVATSMMTSSLDTLSTKLTELQQTTGTCNEKDS